MGQTRDREGLSGPRHAGRAVRRERPPRSQPSPWSIKSSVVLADGSTIGSVHDLRTRTGGPTSAFCRWLIVRVDLLEEAALGPGRRPPRLNDARGFVASHQSPTGVVAAPSIRANDAATLHAQVPEWEGLGADAFRDGWSIDSCPMLNEKSRDAWRLGYLRALLRDQDGRASGFGG